MTAQARTSVTRRKLNWFAWSISSLLTILAVFVLGAVTGFRVNISTMDGQRVGQMFGINKSGFISKTWEAELVRGGMTNGSGAFGIKPFDFTVPNDDLAVLVTKYQKEQTEVLITYHQKHVYWYWDSENDGVFLVDIQPAIK